MLLHGKTALILGYGAIGKFVGKILKVMEMRILRVQRKPREKSDDAAEIYRLDVLPELLPQADVLVISLPGTPETENPLGGSELELLPYGAVLVNIGRGLIVEDVALYNALHAGQIRGVELDMWNNYPPDPESRSQTPPADYSFHELENVVMSPHRGGGLEDLEQFLWCIWQSCLTRQLEGIRSQIAWI